jgi:hypothetical protein
MQLNPDALGVCAAALYIVHCVGFLLLLTALPPVDLGGQMHQCCASDVGSNPNHQSLA